MRIILFTSLLLLACCHGGPASIGLTGAPMPAAPPDPGEAQTGIPGAPQTGTQYAPSVGPNTGAGRFWGYN